MYLYQAAASAQAQTPELVALEIEVVTDSSLDALPRHLAPLTRCPPQPAGQVGAARTFYGNHFEIPAVPLDCYLVSLTIGGETRVEYGFPSVRAVRFDFRKILLHGRVTRAGEGVDAALAFDPNSGPSVPGVKSTSASAESDTSGDYEARVWPGALYRVRVAPLAGSSSPSRFQLVTTDAPEQEKDFALSANTLQVAFRDAKTHAPIPGAKLAYIDSEGSQSQAADQNGELTIESIPAGAFHGTAFAKEYVNAKADWTIEDRDEPQPFEIDLSPKSEGNDFQALLPDGSPAAGAFGYYRFDPATRSRIFFQCDEEGICHPPERPGDAELVYLSHAAAGLTILPAARIYAANSAVLLPPGGPLVVRVKPGPKSSEKCEFGIVTIGGVAIDQLSNFTCGAEPSPLEFQGLPAGQVEVKIVSRELDDHGRYSADIVLAGPVAVVLPSEPIEIAIP